MCPEPAIPTPQRSPVLFPSDSFARSYTWPHTELVVPLAGGRRVAFPDFYEDGADPGPSPAGADGSWVDDAWAIVDPFGSRVNVRVELCGDADSVLTVVARDRSVLRQALCLGQGTDRQLTFDQRMLLWQLLSGVFAERQERLACRVSPDGGRVILDRRLFERPPPDRLLKRTAWQSSTVVLPWDADGNGEPRAFGILTTENL